MLAMPGLRAFSLAAKRSGEGVSCGADGVFVGDVPLLQPPGAGNSLWSVRPLVELNKELSARYRLQIDIASKAGSLGLITAALNRGDMAMAAIAAVQMQIPDPPPLAKGSENLDEVRRRVQELVRSGLLKFFWDPAQHPRAGVSPNPGWFSPVGDVPEPGGVIPVAMLGDPWRPPWDPDPRFTTEDSGGGGVPRGQLEFPFPRLRWSGEPAANPLASPKGSSPAEVQPQLEFPGGLPEQRAPAAEGDDSGQDGPTQGPTRGGRLGNAATRAQNAAIAAELEARGYKITYGAGKDEEYIPGGGPGTQGGTFVDITAVNKVTGKVLRIQTVDTLADGMTPTPREQEAEARIRQARPNDELVLIPKRKTP